MAVGRLLFYWDSATFQGRSVQLQEGDFFIGVLSKLKPANWEVLIVLSGNWPCMSVLRSPPCHWSMPPSLAAASMNAKVGHCQDGPHGRTRRHIRSAGAFCCTTRGGWLRRQCEDGKTYLHMSMAPGT